MVAMAIHCCVHHHIVHGGLSVHRLGMAYWGRTFCCHILLGIHLSSNILVNVVGVQDRLQDKMAEIGKHGGTRNSRSQLIHAFRKVSIYKQVGERQTNRNW